MEPVSPEQKAVAEQAPKKEFIAPIGDVVIGKVDPSIITREQFENSPELLYHGTGESAFSFRRDTVFENPVSATIGEGFYTTDNRTDAEAYKTVAAPCGSSRGSS